MKLIIALALLIPLQVFGLADSSAPTKIQIPFANSAGGAYIRTVPVASQIGIQNGAASYTDGFPPLNFVPVGAGGVPPFGQDMNGILNSVSSHARWWAAGGPVFYDSAYQTAIGGYPAGACVQSVTTMARIWCSTVDNNTSNPDTGGANWQYPNNAVNATNLTGGTVSATTGSFGSGGQQVYLRSLTGRNRIDSYDNPITTTQPLTISASDISIESPITTNGQITSTVATGSAPLVVSSTTPVANLSIGGTAATATNALNFNGLPSSSYAPILIHTSQITPFPGAGVSIVQSHGLGNSNFSAVLELVNLTAECNWTVGNIVQWGGRVSDGSIVSEVWKSATQVGALNQTGSSAWLIRDKVTGGPCIPTPANWAYRFALTR